MQVFKILTVKEGKWLCDHATDLRAVRSTASLIKFLSPPKSSWCAIRCRFLSNWLHNPHKTWHVHKQRLVKWWNYHLYFLPSLSLFLLCFNSYKMCEFVFYAYASGNSVCHDMNRLIILHIYRISCIYSPSLTRE